MSSIYCIQNCDVASTSGPSRLVGLLAPRESTGGRVQALFANLQAGNSMRAFEWGRLIHGRMVESDRLGWRRVLC